MTRWCLWALPITFIASLNQQTSATTTFHPPPYYYYYLCATIIMSKKRPGVEAAKRLANLVGADDDSTITTTWSRVESQMEFVATTIDKLETLNDFRVQLGLTIQTRDRNDEDHPFITKEELLTIVQWKFAVGKPRHALMKLLTSNSEAFVKESSAAAIAKANSIITIPPYQNNNDDVPSDEDDDLQEQQIKGALQELMALKGVGPATASAILTIVRPDVFCYMYDEVIDCFLPKRTYTLPTYLRTNRECRDLARRLPLTLSPQPQSSASSWTTASVATTLWVAARVCAFGGGQEKDHTLSIRNRSNNGSKKKPPPDDDDSKDNNAKARPKRPRRK
jgi:hypothetical protein